MAKSSFSKPAPAGTKPAPAQKAPPAKTPAPATATKKLPPGATPKPTPGKPPTPAGKPAPAAKSAPPQKAPPKAPPKKNAAEQPELPQFEPGEAPGEEGNPEVLPPDPEEALVHAGEGDLAPAVVGNLMTQPVGTLVGEMGPGDYEIPKLKLSQAVGPLAEAGFESGQIVLNSVAILWADGCEEIEITIIKAEKKFVEETPYGADEFGQVFNTVVEANAAGLSTEWGPSGEKPQVLPQVLALILIKKPDGVDPDEFPITGPDDQLYAVALWRIAGTAYSLVRVITGAQRTRLKDGLHTGSFKMGARKEVGKKNTYWVPTLGPGEQHSDEMIQFILENAAS